MKNLKSKKRIQIKIIVLRLKKPFKLYITSNLIFINIKKNYIFYWFITINRN